MYVIIHTFLGSNRDGKFTPTGASIEAGNAALKVAQQNVVAPIVQVYPIISEEVWQLPIYSRMPDRFPPQFSGMCP